MRAASRRATVLICTGMNQRRGENDDYFMYSPAYPSSRGAHWLVDHKVKGVGFDLQALDHILYTYAAQHARPLRPPHGRVQEGVWS